MLVSAAEIGRSPIVAEWHRILLQFAFCGRLHINLHQDSTRRNSMLDFVDWFETCLQ